MAVTRESAGLRQASGAVQSNKRAAKVATYVALTVAALFFTIPLLYLLALSVVSSFTRVAELSALLDPTFANFGRAWTALPLPRWMLNSLIVTTTATVANLLLDSMAGYAFAKMRFAGRDVLFVVMLATVMVPIPVTLLPTYQIASQLGIIDSYYALVLPALAYPLGVFLMREFIRTIPTELVDAARIDGLSDFGIYRRVIVPLAVPGLAVLGLFTFFLQWSSLLWPLVVTTSDKARTVQAGIATVPGEFVTDWGMIAAATLISIIPMLCVFLLAQRYVVGGLTGGRTLKG
jgi:multiple sugar transport system permease protein